MSKFTEVDVYKYFNLVRPSLIRVAADEVTYNFHIMVRYEIERKLIGDEVSVSEVPSLWDDTMEEYLGIRPKKQSEGALQDVHWSGGMIGYFPTYSLGNVIAGMIYERIQKEMDIHNLIEQGNVNQIKSWLKDHVHKYGSVYSPKELQRKICGETYNPEHLVKYLENKYT